MRVKMVHFWRGHQPGQVLDLDRGVADVYVNVRRVAVFVEDEGPEEKPKPTVEHMVPQVSTRKVKRV